MSNIATLEADIFTPALQQQFEAVCVDRSITWAREQEFALQILYASDYARKIAVAAPQSVRESITNVAAIGITLNQAARLAYLVPRDKKITLVISYMGLIHMAIESGSVRMAKAEVVRQNDAFRLVGRDKEPLHEFEPFAPIDLRGPIVGVYCTAKLPTGEWITETMSLEAVHRIRDRTDVWKRAVEAKKNGETKRTPWVTDEEEMVKKTVIRRAYKFWPKTERLDKAIHYMNTEGGEGIDLSSDSAGPTVTTSEGRPAFNVGNFLARIDSAETVADLKVVRREGLRAASDGRDKGAYERITNAARSRLDQLSGVSDAVDKRRQPEAAHA